MLASIVHVDNDRLRDGKLPLRLVLPKDLTITLTGLGGHESYNLGQKFGRICKVFLSICSGGQRMIKALNKVLLAC